MGEDKKPISLNPARLEGESQEEYKRRRKIVKQATKIHLRGKTAFLPGGSVEIPVAWDDDGNPTKYERYNVGPEYRKELHGPIK